MRILARFSPRHRQLGEWAGIYDKIIWSRSNSAKTLSGRRRQVAHLLRGMGRTRPIGSVQAHEIAGVVRNIHAEHQFTARRVLYEARDFFGEAMNYGWIDRNPAVHVRHLPVQVARGRLSLEVWRSMHERACGGRIAWVPHMLLLALVTGQRRGDLVKMRFTDVRDGLIFIHQQKTGERIALPLDLRLDAIGMSIREVVESCQHYSAPGDYLLRRRGGGGLVAGSLSNRFSDCMTELGPWAGPAERPTLHECRSLAERLYREQGVDTRTLLGHTSQAQTDAYNNDRGLSEGRWRILQLPDASRQN